MWIAGYFVILQGLFLEVTIVLICITLIVATKLFLQGQVKVAEADRWLSSHRSWPYIYSGQYGFIDSISVNIGLKGIKLILSIKPVKMLLPESSAHLDTFTINIAGGSYQQAMNQLFRQNSINFLQGVSVELSAIQSALSVKNS